MSAPAVKRPLASTSLRGAAGPCLAALAISLVLAPAAARSQPAPDVVPAGPVILLLLSDEPTRDHIGLLVEGFRERIDATPEATLFVEFLDLMRFEDPSYRAAVRRRLTLAYAGRHIDVLALVGQEALQLVAATPDPPWAGAPIVFGTLGSLPPDLERLEPRASGFLLENPFPLFFQTIRRLQPDTRRIAVVSGASSSERSYGQWLAGQVAAEGFEPIEIAGLPVASLRERLGDLPADSVAFVGALQNDPDGTAWLTPPCDLVAAAASRPLYMLGRHHLGCGVVGGPLVAYDIAGRRFASAVLDRVGTAAGPTVTVPVEAYASFAFDARQLARWGISESRLPPGSEVQFRSPSLWRDHRTPVTVAAAIIAGKTLLVAWLLFERKRRRRVQEALTSSFREVRRLAGALITTQEVERARLARDLHDDLSQSLALLAIDADRLRPAVPLAEAQGQLDAIGERIGQVASAVHDLAHQLHPSRLRSLGVVAALRGLCREVTAAGPLRVRFESPDDVPATIDPAVALCLFRVAQEAIANAWRHGGAADAHVVLRGETDSLLLEVSDNGRGFLPYSASGQGLGLASLRERVRLLGGTLKIASTPGSGTRVIADLPRAPAAGIEGATVTGQPARTPHQAPPTGAG